MSWPEREKIVSTTASYATKIRKAFKSAIDGDAIARQWLETHPQVAQFRRKWLETWALAHVSTNKKPIESVLSRLYAQGYTLGAKVAKTRLNGLRKDANTGTVTAGIVDWSTWTPGMPQAARLVRPKGGLESLLTSRKITVTDEVVATKLDRIGTALATALDKGFNAQQTAQIIDAVIDDPQHALVIARTEMSRAVSVATRDSYESAGIEQVEWLVADGCDICQENADASPLAIDETFPSGDSEPPAHPNCECALAPYYDLSTDTVDTNVSEE